MKTTFQPKSAKPRKEGIDIIRNEWNKTLELWFSTKDETGRYFPVKIMLSPETAKSLAEALLESSIF